MHSVLVALEYCLSEVWTSQGVVPAIVLGHSLGEYAAAVVAGVMSISDCLRLVCKRGRLMHDSLDCRGCMVAVRATADEVEDAIVRAETADGASLAAINSKRSLVLSWD